MKVTVKQLDEPIVVDDGIRYAPSPPDFREQAYEPTLATHVCTVQRANKWTTMSSGRDAFEARLRAVLLNRETWPGSERESA